MAKGIDEERAPRVGYPRARRVQRVPAPKPYSMRELRQYPRKAQAENVTGPWMFEDYLMMKTGPKFDVKAWGAKGDNSTRDDRAIQGAIDSAWNNGGGIVYFPPLGDGANDRYKVPETVYLKPGVSFMGAHASYSRISAHASDGSAYPILDYSGADPGRFFIKNLCIGFEGHYDNVDARCIDFTSPAPSQFVIENVTLRNGYYGYFDEGSSFLAGLKGVHIYQCKNGIRKSNGGAITLDQVYVHGKADSDWDRQAMYFGAAASPFLIDCAIDSYHGNAHIAHFVYCPSLIIEGLGLEGNQDADGYRMIRIENCQAEISGLVSISNVWSTSVGITDFIRISDSVAHLTALRISGADLTFTDGGTGYTLGIHDSLVTITASTMLDPVSGTGSPTVYAIALPGAAHTAQLTLDNVNHGAIYNPNNNAIKGPMGGCHATGYPISGQTINQGNTYTSGDLRGANGVPSNARGVFITLIGTCSAIDKALRIGSADGTPDEWSPLIFSKHVNKYEDGCFPVELGTGANAGKIKIHALSGNWANVSAYPVGYWT